MGYLTLDSIPEGRLCRPLFIPDDPMWLALFGGALTELQKTWNYQQFGTLTPEEMAAACETIINQWYAEICEQCELPDGQPVGRMNEFGRFQMLEGGAWVSPTGDYEFPPLVPRSEATADERRCLAAANAALALKLVYEDLTDAYASGLSQFETFVAFGLSLAARFVPALAAFAPIVASIAPVIFAEVYALLSFLTADLWDSTFDEQLQCILYDAASSPTDVVTFDFNKARNDITNALVFQFDLSLSQQRLALQLGYIMQFIGADGLDFAGGLDVVTSADCECPERWCHVWEPPTGTVWSGTVDADCVNPTAGVWTNLAQPIMTLGSPITADYFEMVFDRVPGSLAPEFDSLYMYTGIGGVYTALRRSFSNTWDGENLRFIYNGVQTFDEFFVGVRASGGSTAGTCSGSGSVVKIIMKGDGADPFGGSNCDT